MAAKQNYRLTLDQETYEIAAAMAKHRGCSVPEVFKHLVQMAADPVAVLVFANQNVAAYQSMVTETRDMMKVIAEHVVDSQREMAARDARKAAAYDTVIQAPMDLSLLMGRPAANRKKA